MEHEDIIKKIRSRFDIPGRWFYDKPRILFWIDPEGEFKDSIRDEFDFGEIQLIVLDGYNSSKVKYRIEHEDTVSKFLVYMPFERPADEDNILADMMHYSGKPFSADKASILCMDLHIDTRFAPLVRDHINFFKSVERRNKLTRLDSDFDSEESILCGMMAVALDCSDNRFASILEKVLCSYAQSPCQETSAEIFDKLNVYGLVPIFWTICNREFGTPLPKGNTNPSLGDLVRIFFVSYLSNTSTLKPNPKFDQLVSVKKGRISTFINSMYNDRSCSSCAESLSEDVAEKLNIRPYLIQHDSKSISESDAFSCIDDIIIDRLVTQITSTSKALGSQDVKIAAIRQRLHYADRYRNQYAFLDYSNKLLELVSDFTSWISAINTSKSLLEGYSQRWHRIDRCYRKSIFYCDLISDKSEGIEGLADLIENTYNNRFLDVIVERLCHLTKSYSDLGGLKQTFFYNRFVEKNDRAVVVIISDALRYECVAELRDRLDTTGRVSDLKLDYVTSTLPSITKFGMAALLPNNGLQVTHDGKYSVLIEGRPTISADDREAILKSSNPDSVRLSYKEAVTFKQSELRDRCKGKRVVYIYHDTVDATGDKPASEMNTFAACENAISEIFELVNTITNKLSFTKYLITSDHGFIYRRKVMEDIDKVPVSNNVDADKRFILSDRSFGMMNSQEYDLSYLDASNKGLFVSVPSSSKIFCVPGAGQNFVHGGLSPQEVVVPVLTVIAAKGKVVEKYVGLTPPLKKDIKKLRQSFDFLQTNPVDDVYRKADYEAYFTNEDDVKVSDTKVIVADKKDGEDLWINVTFNFSGIKKGKVYLHINNLTETEDESQRVEFNVNIMFAMEGF